MISVFSIIRTLNEMFGNIETSFESTDKVVYTTKDVRIEIIEKGATHSVFLVNSIAREELVGVDSVNDLKEKIKEFVQKNNEVHYGYKFLGFDFIDDDDDDVIIVVAPNHPRGIEVLIMESVLIKADAELVRLLKAMQSLLDLKVEFDYKDHSSNSMKYRFPDTNLLSVKPEGAHYRSPNMPTRLKQILAFYLIKNLQSILG
jgi:hypothetical protein